MEALEALLTRRSAKTFGTRAVEPEHLQKAFEAAVRAPDHGRLRPWRFMLIEGDARHRFGQILAETAKARQPQASEGEIARERDKALRAPQIVVVVCRLIAAAKVPDIEQILAAGAATQNFMLALHAQGYGAVWKTGAAAYDAAVKAQIGLPASDHIVGFIYIGADVGYAPEKPAAVGDAMLRFGAA